MTKPVAPTAIGATGGNKEGEAIMNNSDWNRRYSQYTVDDFLVDDLDDVAEAENQTDNQQTQKPQNQQHQQHQQKQQHQNNDKNPTTTTTTRCSTTIHTEPGVHTRVSILWTDEMVDTIALKYQETIAPEINATVGAFLRKCMYAGIDSLVVLDAIEQTGWAKKPSAYYLRAILQRYLDQGIRTLEDVMADKRRREQERKKASSDHRHDWFD